MAKAAVRARKRDEGLRIGDLVQLFDGSYGTGIVTEIGIVPPAGFATRHVTVERVYCRTGASGTLNGETRAAIQTNFNPPARERAHPSGIFARSPSWIVQIRHATLCQPKSGRDGSA